MTAGRRKFLCSSGEDPSAFSHPLLSSARENQDLTRTQESVRAFAIRISSDQAVLIQQAAKGPVDVMAWAMESHSLAQKDPYKRLPKKITVAKTSDPVANCSDRNTSESLAKKHESIQSSYISAVRPDVEMQLAKAGGRLAAVLNSAWATAN